MNGIYFPGLGISFDKVPSGFSIHGFDIKFYGIIIAIGFFLAYLVSCYEAKRTGQKDEDYLDFLLALVIPAIAGARLYYVIFNSDEFFGDGRSALETFKNIINIRGGGLAIYGGLIAGVITAYFFAKKKKMYLPLLGDTIAMGILVGQILGRWGNFFNREAFGGYTKCIFRMAIPVEYYGDAFLKYLKTSGIVTNQMLDNQELVNGISCITVHPTFLYEGLWNLGLLIFLLLYRKKKKFDGEIAMLYVLGYGVGRLLVESLRADSLMVGPLKVSQVVAVLCIITASVVIIKNRIEIKKGKVPKINYILDAKVEDSGK